MPNLSPDEVKQILVDTPPGMWIWRLAKIDRDYLNRLAEVGCKRVYLKVFDDLHDSSADDFFWDFQCTAAVVQAFNAKGISVVGWGYHFDQRTSIPVAEEVKAVALAMACGLDGYIVDVEAEVKSPKAKAPLDDLLTSLREATASKFLGYTSFGHPGFHSEVPWKLLDSKTDIAFPQIYFEKFRYGATDAQEVKEALAAHKSLGLKNPILPIWGSEEDAKHPATAATLQSFLNAFPGSSIFRAPTQGLAGQAWNLDYSSTAALITGPDPAPAPVSLGDFPGELRNGAKGKAVTALQTALAAKGFDPGKIDGEFGPLTEQALRQFQRINELTVDGIAGPVSWTALGGRPQPKAATVVFSSGSRERLASIAETEASMGLSWTDASSVAERYLKPLRAPMQKLGHIGSKPVFYNWCAAFVTYCARQAGYTIPDQPPGHKATMALVEMWKAWAKDQGVWHAVDDLTPERGDIVCFEWLDGDKTLDHIGIVRQGPGNGTTLQTAEGNRNNQSVNGTRQMKNVAGIIRLRPEV
ncbi:peptidoglycan-binding protein [Pseudomonas alkylphenolica]|uniref:Peptidoglycan-binding domain 1 protein n=1 Tax=Pseudomonas alkylphenolica TaxID=237609 RepID=A0A077FAX5_9PSED|nr:peptidoglycan-binding protein [Pseudomonas alkylphenolica]AIL61675.1 Peptidoglycan-binding domain 1 protein [Pseudomonas alkylphenolica]